MAIGFVSFKAEKNKSGLYATGMVGQTSDRNAGWTLNFDGMQEFYELTKILNYIHKRSLLFQQTFPKNYPSLYYIPVL
jgi:hypothetical protein